MKEQERIEMEKARQAEIKRHLANRGHDDGAIGRAFELTCHTKYSRKTRVSLQDRADTYIMFNGVPATAECKTNGGRIGFLRDSKIKFVIYAMDFTQKHAATKKHAAYDERRVVDPVIVPTNIFLAALDRFGATKSTNGRNPEEAIQVSSKKFYEWLLDWPIPYKPDNHYTTDDFEGLE